MLEISEHTKHHIGFLEHFKKLEDPRQIKKSTYPLEEILFLVLCAVLSGADDWVAIALYGGKKLDFLRRFLPYENGTPSHDQLGNVFAAIDEKQFQQCFINWVTCLRQAIKGVVAIDGKTLRRSFDKAGKKGAIHMVSAWCSQQNLVLGQTRVDEKSNEITAIPELLDLLDIHGAIITIDAMGCQREIARLIIDKKADYIFSLKGNQGTLRNDVELFLREQEKVKFADTTVSCHETVEKSHGRLEVRKITVCTDIEWLCKRHDWPGLSSIIMVEYTSEEGEKTRRETRFYISSICAEAEFMAAAIRQHWGVENGLHWVMDMIFRDDECRIRKDNAPANFATIKHMASNILRHSKGKRSMRSKRHEAAWDEDFLFDLITT
ncbi:MAG: ISAs1 family transposase [Gammaproteobacteria bacterium]|nr:ISAs1 family transposase [Gammaproteobacteria bacterium]